MLLETEVYIEQQKISDFSMEGALGFPGRARYWKELSSRRKRHNIRNWTLEEQVLTVFLNSVPFRRYS